MGSSGAGVLNRQGRLVAVHSDGNCATDGTGTNHGWTAAAIVRASGLLRYRWHTSAAVYEWSGTTPATLRAVP